MLRFSEQLGQNDTRLQELGSEEPVTDQGEEDVCCCKRYNPVGISSNEFDDEARNRENATEDEAAWDENDEEFLSLSLDDNHVKCDEACYEHDNVADKIQQGASVLDLTGF